MIECMNELAIESNKNE